MTPGDTIQPTNPGQAPSNGLVAARYHDCDFGASLLHYLATGDNGGNTSFDQGFATAVGVPAPQARAIADKAIQDCNTYLDQQATSAAQSTSAAQASSQRAAAATSADQAAAQAAAILDQQRIASCQAIGGRYDGHSSCRSTVIGRPPGESSSNCGGSSIYFGNGSSQISQEELALTRTSYPGCWPG